MYRSSTALWLLNRNVEASACIEDQLAEFGTQENAAYDDYREFASTLKRRIAESTALQ